MKIQEKDFYYGAALAQIAECSTYTNINKIGKKDGLYQISDDKRILIKYSTSDESEWHYTFHKDELDLLLYDFEFFFVLVCGSRTICLLDFSKIVEILDWPSKASQWITVAYSDGGQMRVRGSKASLPHTIPHNSFPQDIFRHISKAQEKYYAWPPLSRLNFYSDSMRFWFSSVDRMLDLSDNITDEVTPIRESTVYFGLSTISHQWDGWTERNLRSIERRIYEDLMFDGYAVDIDRVTDQRRSFNKKKIIPCDKEFVWRLTITCRCDED